MSICELTGVGKDYGEGATMVRALGSIDLSFEAGGFAALSGPSGSGKTTLLNLIGCLDVASRGRVVLDGRDVTSLDSRELAVVRAGRIGFIFQSFNLIPVLSAQENVEMALHLSGRSWPDRVDRARALLGEVGLGGLEGRRPNQLSGGQQQRVAIARALVKEPALVIADEPTANLDSQTGAEVLDLMGRMNREMGTTFLFSTHDAMVMEHARRVVTLRDGAVVDDQRKATA